MELKEFKQQFRAGRQEAQQKRDELSKKAEGILKEYKHLVELLKFFTDDLKVGKWEAGVKRLKDQGFDDLPSLEEELDKLASDIRDILVEHEKLNDELNRQNVICPKCTGVGYIEGMPEWVEADTGRIQIRKTYDCPLCEGKRIFTIDELLHC